jgi:alpha-D-xyloside xylohydrolase
MIRVLRLVIYTVVAYTNALSSGGQSLVFSDASSGLTRVVTPWGDNSVRIRLHLPSSTVTEHQQGDALLSAPPKSSSRPQITASSLTHGNIMVEVSPAGKAIVKRVSDGRVLLAESGASLSAPSSPAEGVAKSSSGWVAFAGMDREEYLYGLGEHRGGDRCTNQCVNTSLPIKAWDWAIERSQDVKYLPNNGNAWIPFYSSSKGYGFLWNHPGYGAVHLSNESIRWSANATQQIDYWVTTTTDHDASVPPYRDLLKHYTAATGPAPPVPHKYTGFWQCKLRYSSQEQVLRIASGYVERGRLALL